MWLVTLLPALGSLWAIAVLCVIILTRTNVRLQEIVWRFVPREREATAVIVYSIPFAVLIFVAGLPMTGLTAWASAPDAFAFWTWVSRLAPALLQAIVVSVVLYSLLYLIIRLTGRWWWFGVTALMLAVVVLTDVVAVAWINPALKGYEVNRDPPAPVSETIEAAGLHTTAIRIAPALPTGVDVAGLGRRPTIIVARPALTWDPDELRFALAHEIGHFRRGHVWWRLLESLFVIAVGMWIVDKTLGYALKRWPGLGVESLAVPASLPLIIVVFSTWSLLISPVVMGIARAQEHAADTYAVRLTGNADGLRSHAQKEAGRLGEPEHLPAVLEMLRSRPTAERRAAHADRLSATTP